MKEADEILPYRVYVPSTWDGKATLPLVFILHGNTRDHNFYHDRDGGVISKAAEKHGFMLVAPLGYAPNAGYNYVPFNRERGARGVDDGVLNATRTLAQALQEKGVKSVFKEYPGINHDTAPAAATPDVFEFFKANARK